VTFVVELFEVVCVDEAVVGLDGDGDVLLLSSGDHLAYGGDGFAFVLGPLREGDAGKAESR
jgi:hypothetical protein